MEESNNYKWYNGNIQKHNGNTERESQVLTMKVRVGVPGGEVGVELQRRIGVYWRDKMASR